jgi:F-type H+-transporting ATPase subunit a
MILSVNRAVAGIKAIILPLVFLFCFTSVLASEPVKEHEENHEAVTEEKHEKFNAGELIVEHVADAHEWHIAGHTAIALPVILYTPGEGITCFSSGKFEHGHASYKGYHYDKENNIVAEDGHKFYDFSITKNVLTLFIVGALMLWIFLSVARIYSKRKTTAPKGFQNAIEMIIIFIRDEVVKVSIGEKKYMKYMPFLLTVFFFIWISNLLGLIPFFPGGANITGNIGVTMTLAVLTFIITMISSRKYYWHHVLWMPGVPALVKILILTPIEILGVFLKPFVLMIRLFANILAGHIVALSFFSLIFIFGEMNAGVGYGVSIFSWAFTVFMFMLELLVAFLQAYVFTLLSAMYFGAALEEHNHHEHEPHASVNEHIEEAAVV